MQRLLIAMLGLFLAVGQVQAQATAQRSQQAEAAKKQLESTRASIKRVAEEQRRLEGERDAAAKALREADSKVSEAGRKLRETNRRLEQGERELAELQQRRQTLESALSRQRAGLAALVRSAYALGRHEQLKLLLEQDRMSDLARVLAYHRYFQRDRQQRIVGLDAQLQSLASLGEQISASQAALALARTQQQADLDALAGQRRERNELVVQLDGRYRDRTARLSALGRDEKNTAALLERLRKLMAQLPKPVVSKPTRPKPARPGAKPPRGNDAAIPVGPIRLPLAGAVLAGFGGTMPDGHRSQGLLIAGEPGAKVHAVRAGRVAYADWLKGYGLLLILDHGDGWMSLYAFNDALLKGSGDSVLAGEQISTVGSSGGQGRAALYFELRRNGQPQDPRAWLQK